MKNLTLKLNYQHLQYINACKKVCKDLNETITKLETVLVNKQVNFISALRKNVQVNILKSDICVPKFNLPKINFEPNNLIFDPNRENYYKQSDLQDIIIDSRDFFVGEEKNKKIGFRLPFPDNR